MRWAGLLFAAIGWCLSCGPALAAGPLSPYSLCRQLGTDDRLRPIPQSLVGAAARLFYVSPMPAAQIRRSTYFRCMDGRVFLCNLGADLPCGKANQSRHLAGAEAWCAKHPDADFIPMYATGHDTIYNWRCRAGKTATEDPPLAVDSRGFIARYWKPAP